MEFESNSIYEIRGKNLNDLIKVVKVLFRARDLSPEKREQLACQIVENVLLKVLEKGASFADKKHLTATDVETALKKNL